MNVRKHKPVDAERCRALWAQMTERHREIYDDPTIGGEDPGLEFDAHLERVGPDRVWVAVDGEEVVGLVSLIVEGEQAEVEPLVVAAEHRGRGIGAKLLRHAEWEAKRIGVSILSVRPVARNTKAISFFYDAGFTTLGHIQLFMWLGPSTPGQWKPGPELSGKRFQV